MSSPRGSGTLASPVVHWQLVTADPEKAARFYKRVFGWKITDANALAYREVQAEPPGIAGGIWPAPADAASFVQLFVGVDDVQGLVDRAIEHGAKVVVPVSTLPDGAVMAVIRDPVGVTFGLTQRPVSEAAG